MCQCLLCDCIWINCCKTWCSGYSQHCLCASCWMCKDEKMLAISNTCCVCCQCQGYGGAFCCLACLLCAPPEVKAYSAALE